MVDTHARQQRACYLFWLASAVLLTTSCCLASQRDGMYVLQTSIYFYLLLEVGHIEVETHFEVSFAMTRATYVYQWWVNYIG